MSKLALVTGGHGGIGRRLLPLLVKDGYDVISVRSGNPATLKREAEPGVDVREVVCDIRDVKAVKSMVASLPAVPELVFHLAGIEGSALLVRQDDEAIADVIFTNLVGPIVLTKEVVKRALKEKAGVTFVFAGSTAWRRGRQGQSVYSATKAAFIGFSGVLEREYEKKGIRSVVVALGAVDTDMLRPYKKYFKEDSILSPEEAASKLLLISRMTLEGEDPPLCFEVRREKGFTSVSAVRVKQEKIEL